MPSSKRANVGYTYAEAGVARLVTRQCAIVYLMRESENILHLQIAAVADVGIRSLKLTTLANGRDDLSTFDGRQQTTIARPALQAQWVGELIRDTYCTGRQ